jgi:hypothetical protein
MKKWGEHSPSMVQANFPTINALIRNTETKTVFAVALT